MLEYCNGKVQSISRRTLGHDIRALYDVLFQQVLTQLGHHCQHGGKLSITLDAWSSSTRIPFLGITRHYIDKDTWQFRSVLLGFERLRGSYTAESLSRVCLSVLERFHLTNSIRAITTDNASTNTKMLRLMEKSLSGFQAKENHIRCTEHMLLILLYRNYYHTYESHLMIWIVEYLLIIRQVQTLFQRFLPKLDTSLERFVPPTYFGKVLKHRL